MNSCDLDNESHLNFTQQDIEEQQEDMDGELDGNFTNENVEENQDVAIEFNEISVDLDDLYERDSLCSNGSIHS